MIEIDKEVFERNLLLTQAYCELQLQKPYDNNASVLRTFNPNWEGKQLFSFNKTHSVWNTNPLQGDFYDKLHIKQLIHKKQNVDLSKNNYEGKILIAEIDMTVVDGASEAESVGFIDINDCPPIDTWVYLDYDNNHHRFLYAWIPEPFIELVNKAIEVNCVDCLGWYNDGAFFEDKKSYTASSTYSTPTFISRGWIDVFKKIFNIH